MILINFLYQIFGALFFFLLFVFLFIYFLASDIEDCIKKREDFYNFIKDETSHNLNKINELQKKLDLLYANRENKIENYIKNKLFVYEKSWEARLKEEQSCVLDVKNDFCIENININLIVESFIKALQ